MKSIEQQLQEAKEEILTWQGKYHCAIGLTHNSNNPAYTKGYAEEYAREQSQFSNLMKMAKTNKPF